MNTSPSHYWIIVSVLAERDQLRAVWIAVGEGMAVVSAVPQDISYHQVFQKFPDPTCRFTSQL